MVNIVIVGWYGTETIGDRAILAGLFNLFAEVFDSFKIELGTFYPVLTERTLIEDISFYNQISLHKMNSFTMFDTSKVNEINKAVDRSDFVIVGGGPLADIDQMYMLEYTFARAHKKKKRTALLGCGVGPLSSGKIRSSFYRLLRMSNLNICRDNNLGSMEAPFNREKYLLSCDPAVFAAKFFIDKNGSNERNSAFIGVNFREIVSGVDLDQSSLRKLFLNLLNKLLNQTESEIRLIPMHTFYIGGDDRYTLNWLADKMKSSRVHVQNEPLNLEETMTVYFDSMFCIGMRFHAIVLQTILNGRNYILDYTNPGTGKIIHFLKVFNLSDQYRTRYVSLMNGGYCDFDINPECERVRVDGQLLKKYRSVYTENLNQLFS